MSSLTTVWNYRTWILNLTRRELTSRYKRSVLGWMWSLINPAATLAIYAVVFGTFLKIQPPVAGNGHTQVFAIYLFIGLVVWNFFNAVVNGSMLALQASGGMLTKVYFPPESPAIANMLSAAFQLLIETTILVVVLIVVGNVSWVFVLLPLVFVMLAVMSTGMGLYVSVYNIVYRDVAYLVSIFMQVLFYMTPIVYPLSMVPEKIGPVPIRWIIENLNPVAAFVDSTRALLYGLYVPPLKEWLVMAAWSLGIFLIGWWTFNRRAALLIEEL